MADTILPLLKDLITLPGLSGYEGPVRQRIRQTWEPLVDEIDISRIGSLHAIKRGAGPEPRPRLLLAAHMDAIGLLVSDIAEGFLRLAPDSGVDHRVLPGQPVVVHGRRDLPGIIVQPPPACLPEGKSEGPVPLEYLLVDVGLPREQVARSVRPGHLVSFAQPPIEMNENTLVGHSLDNRASVAALTLALEELRGRRHDWDVVAVATVLEETGRGGALTSALTVRPSVAVAVDVTWGRAPGVPEHKTFPVGKGPTNGRGPNIHPAIYRAIKAAAERAEIPLTDEITPPDSGTDAFTLQIAGEGIPTGVVSIPLKNMHTPVELVSLSDIRRVGRLLAEFAAGLGPDFAKNLSWD